MNINKVTLSGNITRDAELRTTASGTHVLKFGIAVNDRVKNGQTGQWEDRPNFFDCTVFGDRTEKLAQYMTKGTHVTIAGKLRWSQWEKDGQKRSKVEVVVDDIDLAGKRDEGASPSYAPAEPMQMYEEDIPF